MTQARSHIVSKGQQAMFHCVTRCVRRAWLCGIDPLTGADHEQRKQAVEARIRQLGEIFAVGIYAYAVMSNHLHVVLAVEPEAAAHWSDDQVAERWLRLFPVRDAERYEARRSTLLATIDRYRERLTDLSWFMKCLDEHIARRANAEDGGAHRDTHHLGTPGHAPPGAQGGGTPGAHRGRHTGTRTTLFGETGGRNRDTQ